MSSRDEQTVEQAEGEETFEIDLEEETPSLDQAIEEAVAAVDRETDEDAEDGTGGGEERIAELEKELLDLRERTARTLADYENFRKRSEREKSDIRRYALTNPLRDFLEVADNIERAMAAPGSAEDLKLGLEMTVRQLEEVLKRYGVEKVEAEGKLFDPNVHEAVSREESEEVSSATVGVEMQKGFTLHDRLLRPARVTVIVPKVVAAADEGEEEQGGED